MSNPKRPYDSALWRNEIRPRILARDNHTCRVPGSGGDLCGKPANCVDHIEPWSEGGDWYAGWNLRASCNSCNVRRRNQRRAALARRQLGEPDPLPRRQAPAAPTRKLSRPSETGVTDLTW